EEEENRLKGERDALRALVARAESVKHRAESVALIAKERSQLPHISSTGHNESQLATAQATLSAELAEVQRLAAAHQGAESEVSTTKTLVQKKKEEAMSRGEELATFDAARKTHREEVTRLTGELAAARAGFDRAHKELDIRQAELAELEQLNGETDQETGAARAKVEKLCKAYEECQKAEATVREQRRTAATAEAKAQTLVHQLEIETESAAARQQALASAAEHDTPEPGSEAAHSEARAQGARELASLLKVADGWEGALSAALGHLSTAFVADDLCRPSIEVSALFQGAEPVAPASEQSKQLAQVLTEANVFSLTDLVTAPAPLIELLEQTLKPLAFCASTEQANHLATHYPRVTMVSRNGTVHTATSVIYPGSGKSTVEIFAELNRATEQLKEAQKQQKTATNRLAEAQERHRAARDKEKNCARSRGAAEAALAAATADLTRCEARQCTANAELQRLASRCATAKLSLAEAQTQLEGATQALDTANAQQPTGIREELLNLATGAQEAAAHAEQKLALAQAELTYLTQQLEAALNRKNQAEQTLKDLQQAQQQAEQQHHRQQERHRAATRTGTAAKALLTAIEGSLAKFHADVLSTEQKLATHRAEKMQLRDELAGAQRAYAAALTLRAESAEGRARIEARWEALDTRAQSELGKGIDTLLDTREDAPENEEPNTPLERSTLEAQLATAQKELKNLGVINPLALEEFEALKQRHDYLTAQIKDLKKSRADLRAVMKDVSAHIEQAFTETFTAVQGQFTEIFAELFPGGEGKLVLSDPADPQHSGIDLQVRPAGKKVTRMSLLSGGERSLASLALLLAVFMARPAPFYVLDEVEAALDDRNLGRLLGVLERLREVSQLIMVTHHQRTMGSADTIYGITMREGVSTVISQRSSDLDP
ncbi:MAG: AAA family ATPase, partial [Rothia sp. (in: high G+C Gram-positive bacteria)]|nr:AAA family ATPase [Rothia sp. (in: high G+C Gram-positive bacteria)]